MVGKSAAAVAEGVSIALAAARLTIKNHILVDTISEGDAFDPDHVRTVARDTLEALAREAEKAADRLKKQGRKAWGRHTQSHGTHDYRDRDVRNLRRRRKQSEGVAARLRSMMNSPAELSGLIEEARSAAWGDVEANLNRRLHAESTPPDADPDYPMMRAARMQALQLVDLQALESQVKARKKHAKSAR